MTFHMIQVEDEGAFVRFAVEETDDVGLLEDLSMVAA